LLNFTATLDGKLKSEFSTKTHRPKDKPLFLAKWKRVILDEAHLIKNPQTATAKASYELTAEARWCVTGTPLQNSLDDIYSLLKFIQHEPWSDIGLWKRINHDHEKPTLSTSLEKGGVQEGSFDRIKAILSPLILRQTKKSLSSNG